MSVAWLFCAHTVRNMDAAASVVPLGGKKRCPTGYTRDRKDKTRCNRKTRRRCPNGSRRRGDACVPQSRKRNRKLAPAKVVSAKVVSAKGVKKSPSFPEYKSPLDGSPRMSDYRSPSVYPKKSRSAKYDFYGNVVSDRSSKSRKSSSKVRSVSHDFFGNEVSRASAKAPSSVGSPTAYEFDAQGNVLEPVSKLVSSPPSSYEDRGKYRSKSSSAASPWYIGKYIFGKKKDKKRSPTSSEGAFNY